jgi:hypothetical protein
VTSIVAAEKYVLLHVKSPLAMSRLRHSGNMRFAGRNGFRAGLAQPDRTKFAVFC